MAFSTYSFNLLSLIRKIDNYNAIEERKFHKRIEGLVRVLSLEVSVFFWWSILSRLS